VTKHFFVHLAHKYDFTFFTISVLSNKFSPPVPLAFEHLPCTDDRNYRPHLQLIYLWWSPDDRGSVCPIYSRPYLLITDQCKDPSQARIFKSALCWIVGVGEKSHIFISFFRVRTMHCLFVIVINWLIRDERLTVSLYLSECGEDDENIERKFYARTAVQIHINRICKRFVSPTVNTTGVT